VRLTCCACDVHSARCLDPGLESSARTEQADMLYKQESLCALHVVTYQSSLLRQIF
jgi:hypothetical protein